MNDTFKPRDETDLVEVIGWAADQNTPVELVAGGSKRAIGRPLQTAHAVDLSALSGITLYEADELVLTAGAGTPVSEITEALQAHDQEMAFEPMDFTDLLGGDGAPTLGGLIAANVAGPRRIKAGGARDHALGIHAVSGRGEVFKSGGRVVKNVTGYDLSKGLSGSWGTLAAFTQITIKVLPKAETQATLLIAVADDDHGCRAMRQAMGSSAEVSGAAHLPASVAANSSVGAVASAGAAVTALRLEGIEQSVDYRAKTLIDLLSSSGSLTRLAAADSEILWQEIRDVTAFSEEGDSRPVWRFSVAPDMGHQVTRQIQSQLSASAYYDWSGGLVWMAVDDAEDAGADIIRRSISDFGGGHATLIRATPELRASIPVFQPQQAPLAALTRRVKESFDPRGILNPGRMYAGI